MVFIPVDDGRWVDENYERLARIVKDYDEMLELRWIPPENRTRDDKKPYIVVDTRTNTPVIYASELDTPEEILAKIFDSDNKHGNVLDRIEARENAAKIFRLKEKQDILEEIEDKVKFLIDSPLNTLRMDGKKFDHQRRVIE
jgi:hypothetical protein